MTDCVKANFPAFAHSCQMALARIAAVSEACGADIQEHCPGLKPSGGRIFMCLKKHFAALSERCKDAISRAAERKAGH